MRSGQRQTAHEYHQRLEEIAKAFSGRYGRVEYGHAQSPSGESTKLEVRVQIPGWSLPLQATLVFIEKHVRVDGVWERYAYLYDLHVEPRPNGRLAYHWHDDAPHRHCEDPRAPRDDHHYEGAFFDDIRWAADELFRVAATRISCRGLRPLRNVPPEPDQA